LLSKLDEPIVVYSETITTTDEIGLRSTIESIIINKSYLYGNDVISCTFRFEAQKQYNSHPHATDYKARRYQFSWTSNTPFGRVSNATGFVRQRHMEYAHYNYQIDFYSPIWESGRTSGAFTQWCYPSEWALLLDNGFGGTCFSQNTVWWYIDGAGWNSDVVPLGWGLTY